MAMTKISKEAVIKIISEIAKKDPEQIADTARFRADLNMDSLAALDLVVTIEEQFGIKITQDKLRNMISVKDLFEILNL